MRRIAIVAEGFRLEIKLDSVVAAPSFGAKPACSPTLATVGPVAPITSVVAAPPKKLLEITAPTAPTPMVATVPAAVDPGLENSWMESAKQVTLNTIMLTNMNLGYFSKRDTSTILHRKIHGLHAS